MQYFTLLWGKYAVRLLVSPYSKPGIEWVQACTRYHFAFALCRQNATSPGRRSNVENAHLLVTNQQRARTPRKLGFALCCHSNATGAPIANPPNNAQLGGSLYDAAKLHPGPCSSVAIWPWTDRQTHRRLWPQYILRRLRLTQHCHQTLVKIPLDL